MTGSHKIKMDFAGWFEALLGGQWHTFDPRNNTPRRGRDAADVALSNSFGPNSLVSFTVWTDETP
jgi:transglutaminase-like putative cysteine protease